MARAAPGTAGPAWWLGSPAAQQAAAQPRAAAADAAPHLFVFLRGVSWSQSADMDTLRVWQGLMQALPTPFQPHLTSPPEMLVAHSGVAQMAEQLFEDLRPHLEGAPNVHLAGHSLGGSLATLLAVTTHLRLHGGGSGSGGSVGGGNGASSSSGSGGAGKGVQPRVQVTTFGSPPVLALAGPGGEDGRALLQVRGACMPAGWDAGAGGGIIRCFQTSPTASQTCLPTHAAGAAPAAGRGAKLRAARRPRPPGPALR